MIHRVTGSKILSIVKTVENININPLSFLGTRPVRKETPPSCNLQDHEHE